MNTPLFLLRAFQIGLKMDDLAELEEGIVLDMIIESANDQAEYAIKPTQDIFDKF